MPARHKIGVVAASALFAIIAVGQPAAAATPGASFHTGTGLTGIKTPVDTGNLGECLDLAQPARSAVNIAPVDIDVYYKPGCETGLPGHDGDTYFILGSLHQANFAFDAVSYRVRPMGG